MATFQAAELGRLNAQIVGHLLAQRSPPRELIARRELLCASLQPGPDLGPSVKGAHRRLRLWLEG